MIESILGYSIGHIFYGRVLVKNDKTIITMRDTKYNFNIKDAISGASIITGDGRPVKILCYDKFGNYPIVALVGEGETQHVNCYTVDGKPERYDVAASVEDLTLFIKLGLAHKFEPYERVLVRDTDHNTWIPTFFGYYRNHPIYPYTICSGESYKQCIPFIGNEHLVGLIDKND